MKARRSDKLSAPGSAPPVAILGVAFLGGISALVFEALWFRQASLIVGNSVWASSLVLAGFMAGYAVGNGTSALYGVRLRRHLRAYIGFELAVGVTGILVTVLSPTLSTMFVDLMRPLVHRSWLLNLSRFAIAFVLLVGPTTAMGWTLPLLVRATTCGRAGFGSSLGLLYGANTLGGVLGALVVETWLVPSYGIRGTAWIAGSLNLAAAITAALHLRKGGSHATPPHVSDGPGRESWPASLGCLRVLGATLICGAAFLALEVLWFRLLAMFVLGNSDAFAMMLSVVLAGIASGGFLASKLIRRGIDPARWTSPLAPFAGCLLVTCYAGFQWFLPIAPPAWEPAKTALVLGLPLVFPATVIAGILFTFLGHLARSWLGDEARTTGMLTLANTVGAMAGAPLAAHLLLPTLGVEGGILLIAATFGLLWLITPREEASPGNRRWLQRALPATLVLALIFFPFGLMRNRYAVRSAAKYMEPGSEIVRVREGVAETLLYLRGSWLGKPLYHRLVTNGFSMSSTLFFNQRYMKLFVYLPIAVHPSPRTALLISFGVGVTAKALTDTRELTAIDVVDISRDILEGSNLLFSRESQPLYDPRVRVHVEDGRFFLQTTAARYDLITGEPPPPKMAGVVNLYTREYFQMIRDRLADGGLVTYWLPVSELFPADAKSIIRAFCDVFADCSLWTGSGFEWVLMGSREASGSVSRERFESQFSDPRVGPEMAALGFEHPGQVGALFLGDAPFLHELVADSKPLVDDYPKRLSSRFPTWQREQLSFFVGLMDTRAAAVRFSGSDTVRRLFPSQIRENVSSGFWTQGIINKVLLRMVTAGQFGFVPAEIDEVHELLSRLSLRTPALWLLGTNPEQVEIAGSVSNTPPAYFREYVLGADALCGKQFVLAADYFREAARAGKTEAGYLELYARCRAGESREAQDIAAKLFLAEANHRDNEKYWEWMRSNCDIKRP